jgi:hypothetical protein
MWGRNKRRWDRSKGGNNAGGTVEESCRLNGMEKSPGKVDMKSFVIEERDIAVQVSASASHGSA